MVENVQCPVCTLFLHAGMNLSDHLETHPKEQVIKALVQMTITGGGASADSALKSALLGETVNAKQEQNGSKAETTVPTLASTSNNDIDISRSNSRMSTISNSSAATSCSTTSSLNYSNNFLTPQSSAIEISRTHNHQQEEMCFSSNSKQSYQCRSNSGSNEVLAINEAFNAMNFSRFQQQTPTQEEKSSLTHLQYTTQSQLENMQPKQTATLSKLSNFGNTIQQELPPPPPPPSILSQQQSKHQQQMSSTEIPAVTATTLKFPATPQQHTTFAMVAQRPQLSQQQQSLKIMYSGGVNLPPPPPLQLFSYQQHTTVQHQKPPPAYGTAISQIRSQQNQNKQNGIPSVAMLQQTFPITQQPQTQHNNLPSNPPRIISNLSSQVATPTTTATTTISNSSSSHYVTNAAFKRKSGSPNNNQESSQQTTDLTSSENTRITGTTQKIHPLLPPIMPSLQKPQNNVNIPMNMNYSPIAVTANRQANSPFPSILSAPSPSSVLRFAESPVAHYLERENGDFIVQETPKHIVECVEEEDGEFSVIERFHHSPPSVLHIHDDNDDDDDNDNDHDHGTVNEDLIQTENYSKIEANAKNNKNFESDKQALKSNEDDKSIKQECSKATNSSVCSSSAYTESGKSSVMSFASGSNSNTLDNVPKKTPKNSITVLSDVQLNLNEYLDLMGNIIASGKIAKRRTCAATAPIPFVKLEKIEPDDEDYEKSQEIPAKLSSETLMKCNVVNKSEANKNETDTQQQQQQIALNQSPSCSKKDEKNLANDHAAMPSTTTNTTPSHVTSVIRMATTTTTTTAAASKAALDQSQTQLINSISDTKFISNKLEINDELTHQQQPQQQQIKIAAAKALITTTSTETALIPQDLSQPQKNAEKINSNNEQIPQNSAFSYGLPPPPPLRKGPKKLVIKPKSLKTDDKNAKKSEFTEHEQKHSINTMDDNSKITNDMRPTTSGHLTQANTAVLSKENNLLCQSAPEIIIKCEPGSYELSELSCSQQSVSVKSSQDLEQRCEVNHQRKTGGVLLLQQHDEYQCDAREVAVDYSSVKSESEIESNRCETLISNHSSISKDSTAEDARVLLDFANSTKRSIANVSTTMTTSTGPTSFFSSNSLFSNAMPKVGVEHSVQQSDNNSASGSLDSTTSNLHQRKSLCCEEEFIPVEDLISVSCSQSAGNVDSKGFAQQLQHKQHTHHLQHESQAQNPFSEYPFNFFYGNNPQVSESATKLENPQHSFSPMYHQTPDATTTTAATVASSSTLDTLDDSTSTPVETNALQNRFSSVQHNTLPQWYQPATLVSQSDFSAVLSIDNAAVDGDVGKYLDLDACKREAANTSGGIQLAPSSTSSSFAAATESSLAGGCTTDTLNIRTDEKMPPKGEISEQESNCDIENSWSQPVYGEIPGKFYRTSFPGIFPHDGGWNQEEFFSVQDLSPSANGVPSVTGNNDKSTKSFEFHLPLDTTTAAASFSSSGLPLPNDDVFPSTSMVAKKKRKRDSENSAHRPGGKRSKPTSTVTSQQLLQNEDLGMQNNFEQPPNQRHPKPTTSSAAAEAAAAAAAAAAAEAASRNLPPTRARRKIYVCPHCSMEFNKLRDKNHHMIGIHNYVRQNRRLISTQGEVATPSNQDNNNVPTATAVNEPNLTFISNGTSALSVSENADEFMAESKHNIQIKMEYDPQAAVTAISQPLNALIDSIDPKSEFIDEKAIVMNMNDENVKVVNKAETSTDDTETKPPSLTPQIQSLPPAPTTKLATLYRMLISYNVSTLKQNQNLSELEEKLIESSIFFCYTCRTNFSSVKLYDAHLTEHPAECFTCGKKFHRWKNFSLHLKRHLGWKEFGCTVCDKKFVVRSALVEHTRMHTGQTPLKCKVCGKSFKRYSNLTQHRKRHGRILVRKKEFVCHCGEVLPSKARFLWHKEIHDSKPKCCPHCCDRFVHANSLRRHIRLAHSDKFKYNEPMECPMCKQVFAKSSIKAHMATHSMDTQHDCNICNKSFSTKWNLKIHLWVHANRTAKPFKCEHCPKAFVREVDFKNHMNSHKQIKPYTCEYCGCKFIRKYNYMRHRREHHGNKKFTCDLCKKSFHRHYYLIEHRRIHTGERPFQCTICGKSSTTKTNHNKHLKIHHSRDPFTVET